MAQEVELDEPLIDFFRTHNLKAIQRVLDRAQKKADQAHRKQMAGSRISTKPGLLVKAMNRAMSAYGLAAKQRASIRQLAPDTGGRPYHFGFTTVTRGHSIRGRRGANAAAGGDAGPGTGPNRGQQAGSGPSQGGNGAGDAGATGSRSRRRGAQQANTRESAHQVYTERDGAVERDAPEIDPNIGLGPESDMGLDTGPSRGPEGHGGPGAGVGTPDQGRPGARVKHEEGIGPEIGAPRRGRKRRPTEIAEDQEYTREWIEQQLAEGQGLSPRTAASSAQAYIEDPSKTPTLMGTTASFGTIGNTLQERMEFWDLVHQHESSKGGRTQTRIVLELPHEATAEDRHEIVRRFTDEFRRKGIPFWASIHAPTKDNDARNHHAHVVLTDRPMRKIRNPETGETQWDFAVAEHYKRANRANAVRYPYRQNRDPEMRDRSYVKTSRARFANIVNAVMEQSGNRVRYDPRSYKDMGLDVAPMRNVTRILADKLDKRSFVVMDAEWTRKMIDAEIQAAAARRDATFVKLQEAEHKLQEAARHARAVQKANSRLPKNLRLSPTRLLGQKAAETLMNKILTTRRDRLATQFADEATLSALEHVAAATAPHKPTRGKGRVHDPRTAPDPDDLAALHDAAQEEIAAFKLGARSRLARSKIKEEGYAREWRGDPPPRGPALPTPPSPGPINPGPSGPGGMPVGPAPTPRPRSPEPPHVIYMGGPPSIPSPTYRAPGISPSGHLIVSTPPSLQIVLDEDFISPSVQPAAATIKARTQPLAVWPPVPGSFADRVFQQTSKMIEPLLAALREDPIGVSEALRRAKSMRDIVGQIETERANTPGPVSHQSSLIHSQPLSQTEQARAALSRRARLTQPSTPMVVRPTSDPSDRGIVEHSSLIPVPGLPGSAAGPPQPAARATPSQPRTPGPTAAAAPKPPAPTNPAGAIRSTQPQPEDSPPLIHTAVLPNRTPITPVAAARPRRPARDAAPAPAPSNLPPEQRAATSTSTELRTRITGPDTTLATGATEQPGLPAELPRARPTPVTLAAAAAPRSRGRVAPATEGPQLETHARAGQPSLATTAPVSKPDEPAPTPTAPPAASRATADKTKEEVAARKAESARKRRKALLAARKRSSGRSV